MNEFDDRKILHELLDYVLDNGETCGIRQYSNLDENLVCHIKRYRISYKIENDDRN